MTILESIARGDAVEVEDWLRRGANLDEEPGEAVAERLTEMGVGEELAVLPPLHLAAGLGPASSAGCRATTVR